MSVASATAGLHREEWTSGGEPLDLTSNPNIHLMAALLLEKMALEVECQ